MFHKLSDEISVGKNEYMFWEIQDFIQTIFTVKLMLNNFTSTANCIRNLMGETENAKNVMTRGNRSR